MTYKFDVAISYAGEDRAFAEKLADGLKRAEIKVFYDGFFEAELWGKPLTKELRSVYFSESEYCIIILSEHYKKKDWPVYEIQNAMERFVKQQGDIYVLPVRLDGFSADVEGLPGDISYFNASSKDPEKVVKTFLEKRGKLPARYSSGTQISNVSTFQIAKIEANRSSAKPFFFIGLTSLFATGIFFLGLYIALSKEYGIFYAYESGPSMVVIPAGEFRVGATDDDPASGQIVRFDRPFAIGKYEITFEEFEEFLEDTSKPASSSGLSSPFDEHFGRGRRPVINVTWKQAIDYTSWLSDKTNRAYRLPSESEWEYAARAGTIEYWWEAPVNENAVARPMPVGSSESDKNDFGLYDAANNVSEWVADGWKKEPDYPIDGAARHIKDSHQHVIRGGAYYGKLKGRNVLYRADASYASGTIGFRVALSL